MQSRPDPAEFPPPDHARARRAVRAAAMIDTPAALEGLGERWDESHLMGLDTEFVRERTFHARPGLVQLSDGREVWLLDPLAVHRPGALAGLLANTGCTKILHSVGEDLDVLQAVAGALPEPLVDTQIAAAMLGLPLQVRYEHLVEEIFGVRLDGGKARNDWRRRPLAPELLEYAAWDVIWLPPLYAHLAERLDRAGRLDWLHEDCARLVRRAREGDATPPLSRIRGAGRLPDTVLACLDELAGWREQQARSRDLPRRFVLADDKLVEIAGLAADGHVDAAIDALPRGIRKHHGDKLRAIVNDCAGRDFDRPDWLVPLTGEQREQLQQCQKHVRAVAAELDIDPALIASKKELARLVRGHRPAWLDGWRGALLTDLPV